MAEESKHTSRYAGVSYNAKVRKSAVPRGFPRSRE